MVLVNVLVSVCVGFLIIFAYRLGVTDAKNIRENQPLTSFDFIKKEDEEQVFDEEFLNVLKSIDEYNGTFKE